MYICIYTYISLIFYFFNASTMYKNIYINGVIKNKIQIIVERDVLIQKQFFLRLIIKKSLLRI